MDIRTKTCIIIRRNGYFLQGKKWFSEEILWTWSAYDAWRTRNREEAEEVARETGGVMVLFNPITGEKRLI